MTTSITVVVPGLDSLAGRIRDPQLRHRVLANLLNQIRFLVQRKAMERVAKKTGEAQRHVFSSLDEAQLVAIVGNRSKIGLWLEKGTGEYGPLGRRIYPKGGGGLAFFPSGSYGPLGNRRLTGVPNQRARAQGQDQRMVRFNVKGQRPQPWLIPAWNDSQIEIRKLIETAGQQATSAMAGHRGSQDAIPENEP